MEQKFFYKIYGLTVSSDIRIREAFECDNCSEADVEIIIGEIPDFLHEGRKKGYGTWTNGFINAWFYTPQAAQFYVEGGKKIVVELEENPNRDLVCSMILSAGFSLILLQRNEIVMHGSAVVVNGQAVIISGDSGAGKSTVTMELLKHQVGFLADDTVRLHVEDGVVLAEPTYPQQKICRNLVEKYGLKSAELRYIDEERDKFALMRTEQYVPYAVPLNKILVLNKSMKNDAVLCETLQGGESLDIILDNLYLADTYKRIVGVPIQLMQQMICVANQVSVHRIMRPCQGNTTESVIREMKQILQL